MKLQAPQTNISFHLNNKKAMMEFTLLNKRFFVEVHFINTHCLRLFYEIK